MAQASGYGALRLTRPTGWRGGSVTGVNLLAIDYYRKSMNIYFMQKEPGKYSLDQIAEMFTDLGFDRRMG